MSFHKIFMKELISAASLAALLPKDVSWILSVKSQGFFFILMNWATQNIALLVKSVTNGSE